MRLSIQKLSLLALATLVSWCGNSAYAAEIGDALVLVEVQRGEETRTLPGVVVLQKGEQSYVVLNQFQVQPANSKTPPQFTIICGDPEPRRIPAKLITDYEGTFRWLIAAEANKLPAPPVSLVDPRLREPLPVKVVGYAHGKGRDPQRVSEDATVEHFFHLSLDEIASFDIKMKQPERLIFGLAYAMDGKVLAYRSHWSPREQPQHWYPFDQLREARAPTFRQVDLRPWKGNAERVRYQAVLQMTDDFGDLKSARLHVKFGEEFAGSRPQENRLSLVGAEVIELKPGTPPDEVVAQIYGGRPQADVSVWIGDIEAPHPGDWEKLCWALQLELTRENGKVTYRPIAFQRFAFQSLAADQKPVSPLPDIPGLKLKTP